MNRSLESNSCLEEVVVKLSFLKNLKSFSFLWPRKLKYMLGLKILWHFCMLESGRTSYKAKLFAV